MSKLINLNFFHKMFCNSDAFAADIGQSSSYDSFGCYDISIYCILNKFVFSLACV